MRVKSQEAGNRWGRRELLLGAVALCGGAAARAQEAVFSAEEFRLLPVRMHLLRSTSVPELNCTLAEADARRILGKVNGVWRHAGIQFYLDSIRPESAEAEELYKGLGENRTEAHLRLVRPRASTSDRMFHLYYIGEMRPNGICLQGSYQMLFVKQSARLYKVPGGIDEELPRVSAHEMGHALSLPHRQDRVNLMASGTTGTSLNEIEIAAARKRAGSFEWGLDAAPALARAEELARDGDKPGSQALYTALAGLPGGEIARQARERLTATGT